MEKQLLGETQETLDNMMGALAAADSIDVACGVVSQSLELRTRDRERKLIHKIDEALQRIEDGTYGYCEETGEPISCVALKRDPLLRSASRLRNATNATRRSTRRIRKQLPSGLGAAGGLERLFWRRYLRDLGRCVRDSNVESKKN